MRISGVIARRLVLALALLAYAELAGAEALSETIQGDRAKVVAVDRQAGRIVSSTGVGQSRVDKVESGVLVSADGVQRADLGFVSVGDIIKAEHRDGRIHKITVLRRAWLELASPE